MGPMAASVVSNGRQQQRRAPPTSLTSGNGALAHLHSSSAPSPPSAFDFERRRAGIGGTRGTLDSSPDWTAAGRPPPSALITV